MLDGILYCYDCETCHYLALTAVCQMYWIKKITI